MRKYKIEGANLKNYAMVYCAATKKSPERNLQSYDYIIQSWYWKTFNKHREGL